MKRHFWSGLGYAVVLQAMLTPAVLFWPNFRDNIDSIRNMAPLPVLKRMVDTLGQGGVAAYVTGQHFFKGCNTVGTAAAVLFAMGAVAGHAQRGTLEIWLARPIGRVRALSERWLAGALAVTVPVFVTSATIPWLLTRVDESMELYPLMLASAHQSAFLLVLYSATFLLSTLGRNPFGIAFGMLLATTLQFALYLVQTATHYSLFRLSDLTDYVRICARSELDWPVMAGFLGVTAVLYGASLAVFKHRVP